MKLHNVYLCVRVKAREKWEILAKLRHMLCFSLPDTLRHLIMTVLNHHRIIFVNYLLTLTFTFIDTVSLSFFFFFRLWIQRIQWLKGNQIKKAGFGVMRQFVDRMSRDFTFDYRWLTNSSPGPFYISHSFSSLSDSSGLLEAAKPQLPTGSKWTQKPGRCSVRDWSTSTHVHRTAPWPYRHVPPCGKTPESYKMKGKVYMHEKLSLSIEFKISISHLSLSGQFNWIHFVKGKKWHDYMHICNSQNIRTHT